MLNQKILISLIIEQSVCAHPPDTRPIRARVHQSRRVASKEHAEEVRNIWKHYVVIFAIQLL